MASWWCCFNYSFIVIYLKKGFVISYISNGISSSLNNRMRVWLTIKNNEEGFSQKYEFSSHLDAIVHLFWCFLHFISFFFFGWNSISHILDLDDLHSKRIKSLNINYNSYIVLLFNFVGLFRQTTSLVLSHLSLAI